MLDFSQFLRVGVAGIPLIFLIIGIVGVCKLKLGMEGKSLTYASVVNGLFWGCGYQVMQLRPPSVPDAWIQFVYWFAVLAYGTALAIVASLFYDAFKGMIDGLIQKAIEALSKQG